MPTTLLLSLECQTLNMQATHESGISCFNGFVWFMMLNVTFN